ncbi:MATE family efflux transporter [Paenibacillus sp. Z3-2]
MSGSGKRVEADYVARTALVANLLLGVIVSIVLFLFPEPILRVISLPEVFITLKCKGREGQFFVRPYVNGYTDRRIRPTHAA